MKDYRAKYVNSQPAEDESGVWEVWLFAIIFVVIFCFVARSNAQAAELSTPAPVVSGAKLSTQLETAKPSDLKFSGGAVISTSSTINSADPYSLSGGYSLTLGVSHAPTGLGASVKGAYSREYTYEKDDGTDGDWENVSVSTRKTWKEPVSWLDTIAISIGGAIPASKESRRRTFLGSIGPAASGSKGLGRFTLSQSFGYSYGFYEYDIRADGTVNSPHSYRSISAVTYQLSSYWSLGADFGYTYVESFQGVGRAITASSASVGYDMGKGWSARAGLGTERGTLEADGVTRKIKVFDPNTTQAFLDLAYYF